MNDKPVYDTGTGRRLPKPTPATPDNLLSICAAFTALQDEKRALFDTVPDDRKRERKILRINTRQEPLVERLTELLATSMQEHAARARSVAHYIGEDQLREDSYSSACWHARLTAAVLRDLAVEPVPASDDAELLRQCDEWLRLDYVTDRLADGPAYECALAEWEAVTGVIATMPAQTIDGLRAKAAILRRMMAPMQPRWAAGDIEDRSFHDPLAWSVANDLAAVPAHIPDLASCCNALGSDKRLLNLCARFDAGSRELRRYNEPVETSEKDEREIDRLLDLWQPMREQITALPARTAAGIRAKAGALRHALMMGNGDTGHERMAQSLVDDLTQVVA